MTILWDMILAVSLVLLTVILVVSAAVCYRLVAVRRYATSTVMRIGPRPDWRHGALRYTRDEARFYRLVSLRFGPDLRVDRASIALGDRRAPAGSELGFAEFGERIVPLTGRDSRGRALALELCLDSSSTTALQSWVEACSTDDERFRPGYGPRKKGRR